jgi:hypothetical protein
MTTILADSSSDTYFLGFVLRVYCSQRAAVLQKWPHSWSGRRIGITVFL